MIAAIVLGAGKSERMGRPKALLPIAGRTFIENILDAIGATRVGQVVVVLGHHRQEIESAVKLDNVVFNPAYEQGMITSVQCGIRALPADTKGTLLFLVDHPLATAQTIEALVTNFKPAHISLPTYRGRRGHPVLFAAELFDELLALPASSGANIVVRKDPSRVIDVAVEDPGILIDIDTPQQFEGLSS